MVEKAEWKKEAIWKWALIISGALIVLGIVAIAVLMWPCKGSPKTDLIERGIENRGLPVVEISLKGVKLEEIDEGSKETKYYGNEMTVYENGGATEFENVELKGRGNTTWGLLKKPYQIRFNKNVDLLGLGKAKKWVLLANALDSTYLRNDIAFNLAEMLEMPYNHKGKTIELYVDGDYRGLYYLVQRIEIAKGSVDLRSNDGALFEVDTINKENVECYTTYLEECLVLKGTVEKKTELEKEVVKKFMKDINEAEKAAKEKDYKKAANLLDMDSFAKYFLVSEFTVNPDAYSTSYYIYRSNDGKIAAGPVWDFDFALANRKWVWWSDEQFFSPEENMFMKGETFKDGIRKEGSSVSELIYDLVEIPEFSEKVRAIFREKMLGREQEFVQNIAKKAEEIYLATIVDREKWGKDDFEGELLEMIQWIKKRYKFFEKKYGDEELVITGTI